MRLRNLLVLILAGAVLFCGHTPVVKAQDRDDHREHRHHVPDWVVGHFKGHNRKYKVDTELTIHADGTIKSVAHFRDGRRSKDVGTFHDGKIRMGSGTFDVEKTDDGFRLIQTTDRSNKAEYHRI